MSIASGVYRKLGLERVLKYEVLIPILKELSELATKYHCLLGSKRSYYDFDDGSRIVWHAASCWFEVQS